MADAGAIGVMGAGAVGCYVGARLAASGHDVVLVGRGRVRDEVAAHGLTAVDLGGREHRAPAARVTFATDAGALARCGVVLCCVKSAQTAEAGAALAGALASGSVVVSLQNGVRNADTLRASARGLAVLGGIVGFNVVSRGDGSFRRGTSGPLVVEASDDARARGLVRALERAGFEAEVARDIRALQWSKLVMNLNNAVSALSGAPTREILLSSGYRRVLRAIVSEALAVMRAAGVRPARLGAIPVQLFPSVLALPTPLLRAVARVQLRIDPEARSSMWEDLEKRRATEVDYLNGEVVRLAESSGVDAPVNRRVVALVHEVEARGEGSPGWSPEALAARLTGA